jgi:hypothetical protein
MKNSPNRLKWKDDYDKTLESILDKKEPVKILHLKEIIQKK